MWLTSSSIGRKVVMSVSGLGLVLFLTFHMAMNVVYIFSEEGYNMVCEFLGTNWYALAGTAALAFLFLVHIVYAFWLTCQNRRARGSERYAISGKQKIEWESKNMLVLGIIVICGLLTHLFNFWYNMMFAELAGIETAIPPTHGSEYINVTLTNPVYIVIYVIWLIAIWYHLNHGFWSALQTIGWNGDTWMKRWQLIGKVWTTVVCLGFLAVIIAAVAKHGLSCGCCAA